MMLISGYNFNASYFFLYCQYKPTDRENLVEYLLERSKMLNPRTLDLHLTAIKQWHQVQGFTDPVQDPLIRKTMEGIRRIHGKPKQKDKALRLEHIVVMIEHLQQLPDNKKKFRDIALILTGFFGAFRRSELVSIQIEDLRWEPEGLIIQLPRSKTDQDGKGLSRALPFGAKNVCPASAIKKWLDISKITKGPLFRPVKRWDQIQLRELHPNSINDQLKLLGSACDFDFELIKKQGGWNSGVTVWKYIEEGQQFNNNASLILMEKMALLLKN